MKKDWKGEWKEDEERRREEDLGGGQMDEGNSSDDQGITDKLLVGMATLSVLVSMATLRKGIVTFYITFIPF